ncbi:MAG: hypothetical protein P4M05_32285 [Bradyrhizobium sp.]|nr:hypothetical protein [Bradyrhizobium sp.]
MADIESGHTSAPTGIVRTDARSIAAIRRDVVAQTQPKLPLNNLNTPTQPAMDEPALRYPFFLLVLSRGTQSDDEFQQKTIPQEFCAIPPKLFGCAVKLRRKISLNQTTQNSKATFEQERNYANPSPRPHSSDIIFKHAAAAVAPVLEHTSYAAKMVTPSLGGRVRRIRQCPFGVMRARNQRAHRRHAWRNASRLRLVRRPLGPS